MVISTVAHVAVGALLLATTVILAIQVWSHVPVAFEERLPQAQRDPSSRIKVRRNRPSLVESPVHCERVLMCRAVSHEVS